MTTWSQALTDRVGRAIDQRLLTLRLLYDADARTRDLTVRGVAARHPIPHPLKGVQYADTPTPGQAAATILRRRARALYAALEAADLQEREDDPRLEPWLGPMDDVTDWAYWEAIVQDTDRRARERT